MALLEDSDDKETNNKWIMYFDGAMNLFGNGIKVIIILSEGIHILVAIKLQFDCTNSVVEYEACVSRLQATIKLKIKKWMCIKIQHQ